MVNVLLVTSDARPVSFQESGWKAAVERVIRHADTHPTDWIVRAFIFEPGVSIRCEEHEVGQLRKDLQEGNVPG